MNWAYIHLVLNHIPVLGTVFGLLLLGWSMVRHDESLRRAALGTFVIIAVVAVAVYFTGEAAEEAVEHLLGTAESAIEAHERAALVAFLGVEALGAIAVLGLLVARTPQRAVAFARIALVLALATAGVMARAANLGGQIRHAELRSDAALPVEDADRGGRGLEQ